MTPIISVNNLTKRYRTFQRRPGLRGSFRDLISRNYEWVNAVDGISLTVESGEMIGYIGPNGAGKSTSIKMLTGILQPTSGEISVCGFHPFAERKTYAKHIGVVFGQRTQLWWDIAVRESFNLLGKIYDVPEKEFRARLDHLKNILDLERLLGTPVRKLSLGERMRCDLTASLLHNPRVLFLDEPTIGLDAVAKESIREFLRQINRDFGTTILLTTHDLREIEELCRRIVVLDKGKILYDGSLERVRAMPGIMRTASVELGGDVATESVREVLGPKVEVEQVTARRFSLTFDPQVVSTPELVQCLFSRFAMHDLTVSESNIDQVIMQLYRDGVR